MIVMNPHKRKSAAELCSHPCFGGYKPNIDKEVPLVQYNSARHQVRFEEATGKAIIHVNRETKAYEDLHVIEDLQEKGIDYSLSISKIVASIVEEDVTNRYQRKKTKKARLLIVDSYEFVTEIKKVKYKCI